MDKNQLIGLVLIVMGVIDLLVVPKIMDNTWRKAKRQPYWTNSLNMIVRAIGVVFIFFGISYYFFGQLE